MATRTPPAGAATTVPSSIWQPPDNIIDPHIELCFSAPWVRVGEQIMIYAEVVDIGLPIYTFRADLSPESVWRLEVRVNPRAGWNEEPVVIISDNSAIVGFVRADLRDDHVIFVLEGRAGGSVNGSIYASGEVHYGYPGPAMWSGGSSDPFTITVAP